MSTLLQDARHAFRGLIQTRGFTATAICTLALGIGAVTVMFSLVDAVLLRPLPYRDPARLVSLHERRHGVPGASLSAHEALAWRDRNHVFDALAPMRE